MKQNGFLYRLSTVDSAHLTLFRLLSPIFMSNLNHTQQSFSSIDLVPFIFSSFCLRHTEIEAKVSHSFFFLFVFFWCINLTDSVFWCCLLTFTIYYPKTLRIRWARQDKKPHLFEQLTETFAWLVVFSFVDYAIIDWIHGIRFFFLCCFLLLFVSSFRFIFFKFKIWHEKRKGTRKKRDAYRLLCWLWLCIYDLKNVFGKMKYGMEFEAKIYRNTFVTWRVTV